MIVDLTLRDKLAIIVGGGNEALKRINSMLDQGCKIIVISEKIDSRVEKLAKRTKIKIQKQKIKDLKHIFSLNPDLIFATTNDRLINSEILSQAKQKKIIAYSSDNPIDSDFSNPSVINFKNAVQVAIFTGGSSPIMSKKIKEKTETVLESIITEYDIQQIKIQKIARELAKKEIPTQARRREYLNNIMNDNNIDQLIKDGQIEKAERLVITKLREWK